VGIIAAPMRRASSAAFVGRDRRFAKANAVVALEPGPGAEMRANLIRDSWFVGCTTSSLSWDQTCLCHFVM
jgi:hypothetical protein